MSSLNTGKYMYIPSPFPSTNNACMICKILIYSIYINIATSPQANIVEIRVLWSLDCGGGGRGTVVQTFLSKRRRSVEALKPRECSIQAKGWQWSDLLLLRVKWLSVTLLVMTFSSNYTAVSWGDPWRGGRCSTLSGDGYRQSPAQANVLPQWRGGHGQILQGARESRHFTQL